MADVKVEQPTMQDRLLASFIMNDQTLTLEKAANAIRSYRQAAEKAQQERDAGICEKVAADWQEKTKLYRSRGNNGPYLGEPTGWSIATAIRSQGHE